MVPIYYGHIATFKFIKSIPFTKNYNNLWVKYLPFYHKSLVAGKQFITQKTLGHCPLTFFVFHYQTVLFFKCYLVHNHALQVYTIQSP